MLSVTESSLSLDKNLFQLTCIVSANDIRLSARTEVGQRQLLALVMGSGDLTFYYLSGEPGQLPIMRRVPWFADANKKITALCFDPSGCWLLVTGYDGSIFIVPALSLVDPNAILDHRWSTTDITSFSSPLLHTSNQSKAELHPTSVVWWHILLEGQHVAILGTDSGDLIFVSLSTGFQVGITYVRAKVSMLHICQDNNLDSVFLLITSDVRTQWKLLLEQRKTGYAWPIDSSGSAVKVVTSNSELSSSSHNSLDLEYGNRNMPHLPTTRSRLQGLKQLSVEKLTNLRQRLAETRSKGAAAMAVNMHFRRESSGSSSDDTTGSPSQLGKQTTAEGTEAPVSHHVTTGPQPEKLSVQVGATFLCPQFAKGRDLLSGYYDPTSILTIHGMSLELIPLSVHKLASNSRDILVTDKFLYITDTERRKLSIVSSQLSESRLDGDAELNPDSIIQTYRMQGENEKILSVYKRTDYRKKHSGGDGESVSKVTFEPKSRGSSRERKSSQAPFTLPKSVKDLKLDTPSVDTCVIVTSNGVYEVSLRLSPTEVFMDLVLGHQALEKAEKLALVFGLNLQQLLEGAGDLKLNGREFPQAISLYKLSRCRHLKSVLKFAAGGHAAELLGYITLLFSTSGVDLTTSERIHLSNLAVMSYTEQVLRAAAGKIMLFKQFLKFLRENLHYDEVLAVNVAGQTGLWEVLQFLASFRGLHPEVLDILTKIVKSLGDGLLKSVESKTTGVDIRNLPALDSGLWLCVSDPSLIQSLLAKPQQARVHLQYVRTCLPHLEQFALQRLAALYDPSSPQLRPGLKRMFKLSRRRERASGSYGSYSMHLDSLDLIDPVDELFVPCEDIVQTFLLVLLYLAKKRQAMSAMYMPQLMEKIQLAKDDDEDSEEMCPSLPVHTNTLSAGFSHVALIRNGAIYTWGNAVQGCLGTGPLMSRYSCPQQVSLMPSLKLEVISVSCGRQHTLALTNNGVYAWGSSQFGQLGIGKTGQSPHPRLVQQLCRERIIAVAAGQYHSIALADDGRVFTWGWGVHGQLGHKSIEDCHTPCLVERLIGKVVIQICGGHGHTIVLTAEGQVHTFGSSVFGQLGNGSNTKSSVPVHVASLTERITMVATSYFHNLAVSSTNKLYIWGSSPQVLRLQAQAQKKARLLQQQQNCSTPPSPARNTQIKPEQDSQEASQTYHNPTFMDSELPVSSSQTSQPTNADKCQRNQSDAIKLGDNKVDSSHIPVTVNDPDVYRVPGSESSSVFSDFENANVGKPSSRSSLVRRDHNLDLQDSGVTKTSNQTVKSDGIDDIQPHLLPQLIDTSLVVGPITQISCGCHHSALLTRDGVLYMWGRNLDGQLGNGTRKEIVKPTPLSSPPPPGVSSKGSSQASGMHRSPSLSGIVTGGDKLRFRQVSCGCEFTIAQENTSTGKVWAWGNNSQAQLGHAPVEDSKPLEGKFVMLKTTKRVIKLPHGTQNSSDTPKEVPGLPSSTITFKYDNMSGMGGWYENWVGTSTELCPPLCSIEEPCYGLRTLHYAFQHFHGYYDSPYLSNKCLELENYQGAAKLAALDRHYHLALAYQLKALALSSAGNAFDLGKHIDTQCTNLNQEISQKISNFKKDLITNTANSNETKKTSTNFSEVSNGAKDTNFNPLIVDAKDNNSHISMTNGNSNYTELNENIGTNTSGTTQEEENIINHTSSQSKDMKATSESNGVCIMPNDKKTESEKVTKNPTKEVENRNKRNSEIHSNFTKSKENEVAMNDNSREKSRVGFVEKIHTEVDIESTNKTKDSISDMGVKAPEGKTEPSPSDEVTEEINSSSSISTPESLASTNAQDSEMHAFAVQGGTEQMSEGHRYLTSPDSSTSPLASEEQSLQSPEPFLPQETPRSSDINLVPITSNGDLQSKELEETITKCEADSTVSGYETKAPENSDVNISNTIIEDNLLPLTQQDNKERDSASDNKRDSELSNETVDASSDSQNNRLQESNSSEILNRCKENVKVSNMDRTLEPTSANNSKQNEGVEHAKHQQLEKDSGMEKKDLPSSYSEVEISHRVDENLSNSKQPCSDRTDLENYENELKDNDKELPVAGEMIKPGEVTRSSEKSNLRSNSVEKSDVEGPAGKDLVAQAAVIVEYYVSVMEEDSHAMMSRLLQQGIEFWLSHSLPVDSLEQLLLKHMSKFFYPLGLLLFCKESSTGEEAERQQAISMLNHLSTRFSLQLCSSLLSHIDQKRAYPEYIELLAQITSIQTSPSLNGCCITNQGLAQSPEQLMEAILEGLGAVKGFGGSLGQSYINFQEEVSDSCKDSSSEAEKLEQLLAFSCGHRYGRSVFHQSVLPELELGLLQLHHPLPNTAKVLKGLFDSNSPNLHLACPRCVLGYLQTQTTPPL